MEKFIYLIIPIIWFLYKTYQNFKKEQLENAKRKGQVTVPRSEPVTPTILFKNEVIEEDFQKEKLEALNKRNEMIKTLQYKTQQKPQDYYNPEIPSQEVINNRKIHAPHPHEVEFPVKETDEKVEFDLKKAIIYQTILNRPQY